jgi:hypothetical protein
MNKLASRILDLIKKTCENKIEGLLWKQEQLVGSTSTVFAEEEHGGAKEEIDRGVHITSTMKTEVMVDRSMDFKDIMDLRDPSSFERAIDTISSSVVAERTKLPIRGEGLSTIHSTVILLVQSHADPLLISVHFKYSMNTGVYTTSGKQIY